MRRRDLFALLGGTTAAWPLIARAQQKAMPVIGWLIAQSTDPNPTAGPIHQGLAETGYIEGQNVAAAYRAADGHYERLPALAQDLVDHKVDLIVTTGGTVTALAAKSVTSTIPIVFASVSDPVGAGLVASLARPGGNITGVSDLTSELTPKQLEVLVEFVPQAKVIALLVNPNNPLVAGSLIRDMPAVARSKGLEFPF